MKKKLKAFKGVGNAPCEEEGYFLACTSLIKKECRYCDGCATVRVILRNVECDSVTVVKIILHCIECDIVTVLKIILYSAKHAKVDIFLRRVKCIKKSVTKQSAKKQSADKCRLSYTEESVAAMKIVMRRVVSQIIVQL